MKRMPEMLVTAVASLLLGSGALCGTDGTWATASGRTVDVHAAGNMDFVAGEGGEAFDLSDLRDGETRTFGQGAKQVTAQRLGNVVTVVRSVEGEGEPLKVECDLPQDTCQVVTFGDEPEKVMIVIQKQRECVNGEGDCDPAIDVMLEQLSAGDAQVHAIVHKVECDDAGNCTDLEKVLKHGPGGIQIIGGAGVGTTGHMMIFRSGGPAPDGQVLLRCPEGDATLHVAAAEADDSYLCPKHAVPLEKVGASQSIRVGAEN